MHIAMMVVIALARLRICATYRASRRITIWTHCGPSGATTLRRRALQASHQRHNGLAVQESKGRCDMVSLYTVASGRKYLLQHHGQRLGVMKPETPTARGK